MWHVDYDMWWSFFKISTNNNSTDHCESQYLVAGARLVLRIDTLVKGKDEAVVAVGALDHAAGVMNGAHHTSLHACQCIQEFSCQV